MTVLVDYVRSSYATVDEIFQDEEVKKIQGRSPLGILRILPVSRDVGNRLKEFKNEGYEILEICNYEAARLMYAQRLNL